MMKTDATSSPESSIEAEPRSSAQSRLAFVTGNDAKKVGIVQSVIGHAGVKVGSKSKAGLLVLVDVELEQIKKYRGDADDSCWILALTETGSAGAFLTAGASDVLSGRWSVNDLCDRIDVALSRMAVVIAGEPPVIRQERTELVSTHSRSDAIGMVEWMLRGVEDTITRMMLSHAMVETKCPGVVLASEAAEDLRVMTSELAAAVRVNPDLTASCDFWSVLAGGLGFPLLGEGRAMITDLPETLPALRGSRHTLEHALRSLVKPLVRQSSDGQIIASAMLNGAGDQLLISFEYEARLPMANDDEVSVFNDGPVRYQRTTDRLLAVASAKIASLGGELLSADAAGLLQLRLPVMSGSVESSREDVAEPARVVLIEPDDALRDVLELYFSMQSVHTVALLSIERAEELIERAQASSFAPDVFVVAMQTAMGIFECPSLRAMSKLTPVIVTISGDSDEAALVSRMDGVAEVLRKPYTAETLLTRALELALDPGNSESNSPLN